jgi:MFS family permease
MFCMAALGPVLAEIRAEFDISFAGIGFIVAVQGMGRGGFMLLLGSMADRVSARRLLPLGLAATGLATLLVAAAPNIWILVVGLLAGGLGFGLVAPSAQVHVAQHTQSDQRRRDIGRMMSGGMFGAFLAPMVAGFLASTLGWRSAFVAAALLAFVSAVLISLVRSLDTPRTSDPTTSTTLWSALELRRSVLAVSVLAVLIWGWANATRGIVLPLYGSVGLGLGPDRVGLLLTITLGGRAVLFFVSGSFVNRFGMVTPLVITCVTGIIGTLLLVAQPTTSTYVGLGIAFAFNGLGSPLILMLLAERASPHRMGRAVGVTQFLVDSIGLAMPPLIGLVLDLAGFSIVGVMLAVMSAMALIWGLRIIRETTPSTGPNLPTKNQIKR